MKKLVLALITGMFLMCFGAVFADGKLPETGTSAILEQGNYYGIGTSIPEGSYLLTCVQDEEMSWYSSCDVLLTSYDFLQINEDAGISLDFPMKEDGFGAARVFLKEGMLLRVRYSDVTITAVPEAETSDVLDPYAYYGIGYDIPEGDYFLSCTDDIVDTFCTVSILTYTNYFGSDMGYNLHLDNYGEDGVSKPVRVSLKAGTILETHEIPIRITRAEPLAFK